MNRKTVLCIDIGTTWAKFAVFEGSNNGYRILHNSRIRSKVEALNGSQKAVREFSVLCAYIEDVIGRLIERFPIQHIGLTGIREGLVFVDKNNDVVWASGNSLLEDKRFTRFASEHGKGSKPVDWFAYILKAIPEARSFLSLQGYISYKLTNKSAITESELLALGIDKKDVSQFSSQLRTPDIVEAAERVANHSKSPQITVHLGGTDEQASFYGAGVGRSPHIAISTGSYWAIAAGAANRANLSPYIRLTPKVPPYPRTISIVGYKWGMYLEQICKGIKPMVPSDIPIWAKGELLRYLHQTKSIKINKVIELISKDIKWGLGELFCEGIIPKKFTLILYGGGVLNNYLLTQDIMNKVNLPWRSLDVDASQLGCFYAIVKRS